VISGPAAEPAPDTAREIMKDFAHSTGLTSDEEPKRYLWTDAFAVCNYLGLHTATGEEPFRVLALELVDQVHRILGRHRPDDPREGWISGLSEAAGARHPTAGGLRIGKPAPERWPDEPHNPRTEWDRDGQYYHYLTKWMHALSRVWQVTGDETYHGWAVELGEAAHRGFLVPGTGSKRLSWKMSIDLSRRLVPSTGLHDPLDGFLHPMHSRDNSSGRLSGCDREPGPRAAALGDPYRARILARLLRRPTDQHGMMCAT
jgi:hypothetical protein